MEPFQEDRLSETAKKEISGKQSEASQGLKKAVIKQIESKDSLDKGAIEVLKVLLEKEGYLAVPVGDPHTNIRI